MKKFKTWNTIDNKEIKAATRVLKSGTLSAFYGSWSERFWGGPEVRSFEMEWARYFKVKHVVAVNSATSGLYAAVGALPIQPGDEIIVTPASMCASATAPLIYGAIPVFADLDPNTFCLDPKSIEKNITKKTKAILVVNLFGHPADMDAIMKIARKHKLYVIEDNAQGPGAIYKNKFAGTIADIGVFSLNCHKHIQTGEGGMIVTNNDKLRDRLCLIRNHAEAVVEAKGEKNLNNMIGWNYRMTEMEAAIGREQLKKLSGIVSKKVRQANWLTKELKMIDGLTPPLVKPDCKHVYYVYPIKVDIKKINREKIVKALQKMGIPVINNYVKPLYQFPLYQKKIAFGKYPFNLTKRSYKKGLCPVAERLFEKELFYIPWCSYDFSDDDINLIRNCILRVIRKFK